MRLNNLSKQGKLSQRYCSSVFYDCVLPNQYIVCLFRARDPMTTRLFFPQTNVRVQFIHWKEDVKSTVSQIPIAKNGNIAAKQDVGKHVVRAYYFKIVDLYAADDCDVKDDHLDICYERSIRRLELNQGWMKGGIINPPR